MTGEAYRCGHPRTPENSVRPSRPRCRTCENAHRKLTPRGTSRVYAYSSDPLFSGRAMAVAALAAGFTVESLLTRRRWTELVKARYAVMLAMRRREVSYPSIGRRLHRDHSTVMTGVRRAEALLETCPDFAALFAAVDAA